MGQLFREYMKSREIKINYSIIHRSVPSFERDLFHKFSHRVFHNFQNVSTRFHLIAINNARFEKASLNTCLCTFRHAYFCMGFATGNANRALEKLNGENGERESKKERERREGACIMLMIFDKTNGLSAQKGDRVVY